MTKGAEVIERLRLAGYEPQVIAPNAGDDVAARVRIICRASGSNRDKEEYGFWFERLQDPAIEEEALAYMRQTERAFRMRKKRRNIAKSMDDYPQVAAFIQAWYDRREVKVHIRKASKGEDKRQATDLWVVENPGTPLYEVHVRVQVKMREQNSKLYPGFIDIGINKQGHSKQYSEAHKMQRYGVKYLVYGIYGEGRVIARMMLCDLAVFWGWASADKGKMIRYGNGERKVRFPLSDVPDGFVLSEYPKEIDTLSQGDSDEF